MTLTSVLVIGLTVYFWRLSLTVAPPLNFSDYANNLLYGQSILSGNLLLHGWITLRDPMFFGDLLYAAGLKMRGFDPVLLQLVPVAVSTMLAVLVGWTSVTGLTLSTRERIVVIGVAVLPLVLPSPALAGQVLVGPNHTDTTAAALGAILALAPRSGLHRAGTRFLLAGLGGIMLALGTFGDPYMLALGIVPIAGFVVYRSVVRHVPLRRSTGWLPMIVALAAWGAAQAALWLVPRLGGFTMRPSISPFIMLDDLGPAVVRCLRAFLDLSGANFFGMPVGMPLLSVAARLGYLGAAVWAVGRALRDFARGAEGDWTTSVLALAVLMSGAGTFLYPGASYAFQVPVFLLMSVVLARHLATAHRRWLTEPTQLRFAAALVICGLFTALPIEQLQGAEGYNDPSRYPQLALAQWLEQHGLRQGYGPYGWASVITVQTRGRVTVRALISTSQYRYYWLPPWTLIPNIEQMGNAGWYTAASPASFLIVDKEGIDRQTALQTFGPPDHTYHVVGVDVLSYSSGIVCTIPQSAQARAEEAAGVPPHAAACARARR